MLLDESCDVQGKLVIRNTTREASFADGFPKFLTFVPAETVIEDCWGAVISAGGFDLTVNGKTHTMAHSRLFADGSNPDAGFSYYTGQEANLLAVCQWWINGKKTLLVECEYDPGM